MERAAASNAGQTANWHRGAAELLTQGRENAQHNTTQPWSELLRPTEQSRAPDGREGPAACGCACAVCATFTVAAAARWGIAARYAIAAAADAAIIVAAGTAAACATGCFAAPRANVVDCGVAAWQSAGLELGGASLCAPHVAVKVRRGAEEQSLSAMPNAPFKIGRRHAASRWPPKPKRKEAKGKEKAMAQGASKRAPLR